MSRVLFYSLADLSVLGYTQNASRHSRRLIFTSRVTMALVGSTPPVCLLVSKTQKLVCSFRLYDEEVEHHLLCGERSSHLHRLPGMRLRVGLLTSAILALAF